LDGLDRRERDDRPYSWVQLGDAALASISAFNTACCLLVFCIAGYKRIVFTRSRTVDPLAAA
jgi:hypothetical protein